MSRKFHQQKYFDGPYSSERARFLRQLAEDGYGKPRLKIINNLLLAVAHAVEPGSTYTEAGLRGLASEWIRREPEGKANEKSKRVRELDFLFVAKKWLSYLGRFEKPTPSQAFKEELQAFLDYQRNECGFAAATIENRRKSLTRFFLRLQDRHQRLADVELRDIDEFQAHMASRGWKRTTMSFYVQGLRSFFRYAFARGWTSDLAPGIGAPRIYQHETIPTGPSRDEVVKLLENESGPNPVSVRNRAMFLLLAVYGLRSGEVRNLQLKDLDWQNELLTVVRTKIGKTQSYPLTREVGDAILKYLKTVRPATQRRTVFLTLRRPHRPISAGGFGAMVQKRLHAVNPTLTHEGPHSIRHACAAHLLQQGLDLGEIGNHLGHVSVAATRIYAKVDIPNLRAVAAIPMRELTEHADEAERKQTPILERGHMEALRLVANTRLSRLEPLNGPSRTG
ncbi:MAG: tyrosine-type recombinase/integrase [Planctomycetaceae bacterium]